MTQEKPESARDLFLRLEKLQRWHEDQQDIINDKLCVQKQVISSEQERIYETFGFSRSFSQANEENPLPSSKVNDDERNLIEENQIPTKKRFLRRGEGLKNRFNIDPDIFRLHNLPKYKYGNITAKRKIRESNKAKEENKMSEKRVEKKGNKERKKFEQSHPQPEEIWENNNNKCTFESNIYYNSENCINDSFLQEFLLKEDKLNFEMPKLKNYNKDSDLIINTNDGDQVNSKEVINFLRSFLGKYKPEEKGSDSDAHDNSSTSWASILGPNNVRTIDDNHDKDTKSSKEFDKSGSSLSLLSSKKESTENWNILKCKKSKPHSEPLDVDEISISMKDEEDPEKSYSSKLNFTEYEQENYHNEVKVDKFAGSKNRVRFSEDIHVNEIESDYDYEDSFLDNSSSQTSNKDKYYSNDLRLKAGCKEPIAEEENENENENNEDDDQTEDQDYNEKGRNIESDYINDATNDRNYSNNSSIQSPLLRSLNLDPNVELSEYLRMLLNPNVLIERNVEKRNVNNSTSPQNNKNNSPMSNQTCVSRNVSDEPMSNQNSGWSTIAKSNQNSCSNTANSNQNSGWSTIAKSNQNSCSNTPNSNQNSGWSTTANSNQNSGWPNTPNSNENKSQAVTSEEVALLKQIFIRDRQIFVDRVKALSDRIALWESEILNQKKIHTVLIRLRQELELQNIEKTEEYNAAQAAMEEKFNKKMQELNERCAELEEQKASLQKLKKKSMKNIEKDDDLKKQLEDLKNEMKEKEIKHGSSQARLRSQIRQLETDLRAIKTELENVKKDNKRLEGENIRLNRRMGCTTLKSVHSVISKKEAKDDNNKVKETCPASQNATLSKSKSLLNITEVEGLSSSSSTVESHKSDQDLTTNNKKYTPTKTKKLDFLENQISKIQSQIDELCLGTERGRGGRVGGVESELLPSPDLQTENKIEQTTENNEKALAITSSELSSKVRVITNTDGSKDILYKNGNMKKISSDGMTIRMLYYNKDIKETSISEGTVKYYYAETNTWHTTYLDGLEVLEFPNGQTELRQKTGVTEIRFPNGFIKVTDPQNPAIKEEWRYPDGKVLLFYQNGDKVLKFPNGQTEVETKEHKRREYPDGTIKFVFPDGSQETRYSNGRRRIKDKNGKLVMDTGGTK